MNSNTRNNSVSTVLQLLSHSLSWIQHNYRLLAVLLGVAIAIVVVVWSYELLFKLVCKSCKLVSPIAKQIGKIALVVLIAAAVIEHLKTSNRQYTRKLVKQQLLLLTAPSSSTDTLNKNVFEYDTENFIGGEGHVFDALYETTIDCVHTASVKLQTTVDHVIRAVSTPADTTSTTSDITIDNNNNQQ